MVKKRPKVTSPARAGTRSTRRAGTTAVRARATRSARDRSVQTFLDEFAAALTAGRTEEIVSKWGTPGLVIANDDTRAVSTPDEVEAFFAGARDQYNARGITDTRADILALEWATDRIAIVHVRWPYLDVRGREMGDESSSYVLRRDDRGRFRFYVAVLRGASGSS